MAEDRSSAEPRLRSLVVSLVVGGAVGAAGVLVGFQVGGSSGLDLAFPDPWLAVPAVIVALVATLAVHEAGHIAAGLACGFAFVLYVVGPLRIVREADGRLTVGANLDPGLVGGIALAIPRQRGQRKGLLWLYAGGPVASVLLAVGILGGAAAAPELLQQAWFGPVLVAGATSAVIGLLTLVPMANGPFMSDGHRVLTLLRGGKEAEAIDRALAITHLSRSGVRPRDWDPELVAAIESEGMPGMAGVLYEHALDRGDLAAAARHAEALAGEADRLPRSFRPGALASAAYWFARHGGDVVRARELLERSPRRSLFDVDVTRGTATAAVQLAEGDRAGSRDTATETLKLVQRAPGAYAVDAERLQEILEHAGRA